MKFHYPHWTLPPMKRIVTPPSELSLVGKGIEELHDRIRRIYSFSLLNRKQNCCSGLRHSYFSVFRSFFFFFTYFPGVFPRFFEEFSSLFFIRIRWPCWGKGSLRWIKSRVDFQKSNGFYKNPRGTRTRKLWDSVWLTVGVLQSTILHVFNCDFSNFSDNTKIHIAVESEMA